MRKIIWDNTDMLVINEHGEICMAAARKAMERSGLSFDDIEYINQHYEVHRWGSNADRKYRKSAIEKAVKKIAENPLKYA
jgi:3-oxoacyl-(acyl-carrier-protein) synthase